MKNKKEAIMPDWKSIAKVQKYKKEDFDKLLGSYLKSKKEIYTKIKSLKKEERGFENTILALENSGNKFTDTIYQINAYAITHKDRAWRDMANEFQKEMSTKVVDIEHDKDIYLSVKDYFEGNYKKEKKDLDKKYGVGSVKLVEDTIKGYKRMGFNLPKLKQDKLKNNLKKIAKLSLDFSKNIDEYKDFILCNEEEIKGLPENFVKSLERADGKYKVTLDYPSIGPFMQYAESREKRKELIDKSYRKGGEKNLKILSEVIKLRDQNAKILGYKNHVDLNTENRMAKSEKNVRDFLESSINKLSKPAEDALKELNSFAKNNLEQYKEIRSIEYYDNAYVSNKLKESKYSYDSAKLKEYFELEHTLKIMFSIFGELFNFSVSLVQDKEKRSILVDKDVKLYELKDKNTKQIISYLILDSFPRDGKYGHACSAEFVNGGDINNKRKIPINELICNFQKSSKSLPSLLTLGEVETLFHEFGHGVHYMLTEAVHTSQAGYQAVWDFVETPSQMLENFLFEENNLKKIAVHYKKKTTLDKDTIRKILSSKNFLKGFNFLWLFIQSLYDIDIHSNKIRLDNTGKNLSKEFNKYLLKYLKTKRPESSLYPAGWGHLVGGYDAGYYSYMWALVYAQDIYSEFEKAKDSKSKLKEVGERYRKEILEVGGSRDELLSVKKFLKRSPNSKAFLKELGVF